MVVSVEKRYVIRHRPQRSLEESNHWSFYRKVFGTLLAGLLFQIASAKPTNPCKKSQHWVENADGPPQCIDCQACPPGQTISPECGNSKPLTPDATVFCVPCQLGKSFSNEFSTSVCIPCSSCSKDQVVMKNCSRQADIECGKRCYSKDRYYDESKGDCLKCSKCCNDDQDVVESECIEKLGSQSSMICSFHSSVNRCNIKSTPKFVPQVTTESSQSSAATTSSHIVTVALTNTSADVGDRLENITHSGVGSWFASKNKDCNDSCISIIATVVLLLLVIITIIVSGIYLTWFCKSRSPTHSCVDPDGGTHKTKSTKVHYNSGLAAVELCEPLLEGDGKLRTSACHNAEQLVKSDSKPIGSLLDSSELETICELLDTPIGEKLAYEIIARFYGANYFKIKARFQDQKSKAVIEWLATERPELAVWEFANVVRREAGRTDVANRLKAFDAKATKELTDV